MSEGATRPETAGDLRERAELDAALIDSPVVGKPLEQRLRNFTADPATQFAALGGPLAWMRRLRDIELLIEVHEAELEAAWRELARECSDAALFAVRWSEVAASWRFDEVNELIARHNRWYPVEARLPMDPATRDFALVNGKPYKREPLDARWIVERFPLDFTAASETAPPSRPPP